MLKICTRDFGVSKKVALRRFNGICNGELQTVITIKSWDKYKLLLGLDILL